jgi:hypothetical protein
MVKRIENPYQPPPASAIVGHNSLSTSIRVAIFSFVFGAVVSIVVSSFRMYSKPVYTPYAIDSVSTFVILSSVFLSAFVQAILIGSLAMIAVTALHKVRNRPFKESRTGKLLNSRRL